MVGWHHQFNGREFEQAPGESKGQGSQACCSPWGCKETEEQQPSISDNFDQNKKNVEHLGLFIPEKKNGMGKTQMLHKILKGLFQR